MDECSEGHASRKSSQLRTEGSNVVLSLSLSGSFSVSLFLLMFSVSLPVSLFLFVFLFLSLFLLLLRPLLLRPLLLHPLPLRPLLSGWQRRDDAGVAKNHVVGTILPTIVEDALERWRDAYKEDPSDRKSVV